MFEKLPRDQLLYYLQYIYIHRCQYTDDMAYVCVKVILFSKFQS